MQLSDADRDLMARTILAEAGPNASPTEQAAIAHVILNRVESGNYGSGIGGVISKPGAFEPWSLPAGHPNNPMQFDPNSPGYQTAAAIADAAASGSVTDPTKGATHFLQPEIVMHRVQSGQMGWPSWAAGKGLRIGQHAFYAPAEGDSAAAQKAARDYSQLEVRYPAAPEPGAGEPDKPATAPSTGAPDPGIAALEARYPAPPEQGEEKPATNANARVQQGFEDVQPVSALNRSGEPAASGPLGPETQAKFNRFMNQLMSDPEKAAKDNPAAVAMLVAAGGPLAMDVGGPVAGLVKSGASKVLNNPLVKYPLMGAGIVAGQQLSTEHPIRSLLDLIAAH